MKRRFWDSSCGWVVAVVAGLVLAQGAIAALRLTWQDNSGMEAAYWVLRQRVPQEKGFQIVATLPANAQTWVDTSTRRNQNYCYMVVAVKDAERSYSDVACRKDDGRRVGGLSLRFASAGGQPHLDVD